MLMSSYIKTRKQLKSKLAYPFLINKFKHFTLYVSLYLTIMSG